MARTRFGAGQRVVLTRAGMLSAPTGVYRMVSALPLERGPQQYRVRCDGETLDRIVDEVRLAEPNYE